MLCVERDDPSTTLKPTMYCTGLKACLHVTSTTPLILQGLFVPFESVGYGDPVRVLCLFHNEYAGFN